jgi:peptidoglycan-associated lipoprotein
VEREAAESLPRPVEDRPDTTDLQIVYFPYNSSEMALSSREALEANLAWLRANPDVRVRLEGHTDVRGTPEYNLALGQRRANYVRGYLTQRGIDRDRLDILSYGQELVVSHGQSESDHARNRRVEFVPLEQRP